MKTLGWFFLGGFLVGCLIVFLHFHKFSGSGNNAFFDNQVKCAEQGGSMAPKDGNDACERSRDDQVK